MAIFRMDKFLADMGCGTRSEVKNYIKKGRVMVNGIVEKSPEKKIDTEKDRVILDGQEYSYVELEYFMLNKPQGVVSATEDRKDKTVLDLIDTKNRKDLFPVGRLDKDTEGLLLITNDGKLAHQLLSPKKHVDKVYYAEVSGIVGEEQVERFREGLLLEDGTPTKPAVLKILDSDAVSEVSRVELTIQEGKFHQVKRMFEACGQKVTFLKRLRMGTLLLDDALAPGEYRRLTVSEIEQLKKTESEGTECRINVMTY